MSAIDYRAVISPQIIAKLMDNNISITNMTDSRVSIQYGNQEKVQLDIAVDGEMSQKTFAEAFDMYAKKLGAAAKASVVETVDDYDGVRNIYALPNETVSFIHSVVDANSGIQECIKHLPDHYIAKDSGLSDIFGEAIAAALEKAGVQYEHLYYDPIYTSDTAYAGVSITVDNIKQDFSITSDNDTTFKESFADAAYNFTPNEAVKAWKQDMKAASTETRDTLYATANKMKRILENIADFIIEGKTLVYEKLPEKDAKSNNTHTAER